MYAVVFLMIFASVALLLIVLTTATDKAAKQTRSRLDAIRPDLRSISHEDDLMAVRRNDVYSNIPWLDRFLNKLAAGDQLRTLLRQADLTWTAGRVVLMSALCGMVCGYLVFLRTDSAFLGFVFLLMAGSLPLVYVVRQRNQRFDRIRQQLPEALDMLVAAIRAGHSFSSALAMASRETPEPLKRELKQCHDEQNFGLDLRVSMLNLSERVPIKDIRMITTAVLIQKETGGNLTEILEKAASLVRDDFRLQRQVRVHTAQGRLTGWILSVLPVILGLGLYLVNPDHMSILWHRPIGVKMLYGAFAMTVTGGLIIRKIVRIQI